MIENKIHNLEKVPLDLGIDSEQANDTKKVRPAKLASKPTANAARVARVAKAAKKASEKSAAKEDKSPVPPLSA